MSKSLNFLTGLALLLALAAQPARANPAQDVVRDPGLPQDAKGLDFEIGRALFERHWAAAPASTQAADGLGPLFNARACVSCHPGGGRGVPFDKLGATLPALLFRLGSHHAEATLAGDPLYGQQIQTQSVAGIGAEASVGVSFETHSVTLADGTVVELRKPIPKLDQLAYGPLASRTVVSPRLATAIHGIGLLEQIPEREILANKGKPNYVIDPITGQRALGRFGWKAGVASLEVQDAKALDLDIGLSNPVYRDAYGDCTAKEVDCLKMPTGVSPQFENLEVPSSLTRLIDRFVGEAMLPPVPAAENAEAGRKIFAEAGCGACHTSSFQLADGRNIAPYTDLLLHDMGFGLADHMAEGEASGKEWRTAPLWGIGQALRADDVGLLHDGRARNVLEAILWHDGEAAAARAQVEQLSTQDRQALIDFIGSL
ncbi:di-heme oxidoredictase family protein [Dongia sedimenti]|uniref:Di-heme oxidoredictase family protein n=1 Tax=Dongia sedimenti TaxID=3064282 RepID=A0ABU0YT21_9PROT|nr:di-heme oxidoredictase family protein [Rhodospirillaceae bacterium R-7]